jgi:hypothetical protein
LGRVGRRARETVLHEPGGDRDYPPPAAGAHGGDRGLGERVRADQICLDRRAQAFQRNRLERLAGGTALAPGHRVVNQDVDAAEVAPQRGHRRADPFGLCQVERHQRGASAGPLHRLGGVLRFRSAAVIRDGDAGALRTEGDGGGPPDVARGAGDQHAPAPQSEIHRPAFR